MNDLHKIILIFTILLLTVCTKDNVNQPNDNCVSSNFFALSYFVGHDSEYAEDHGFAIKPWSNIRWKSIGVKSIENMAIALGNYLSPLNKLETINTPFYAKK